MGSMYEIPESHRVRLQKTIEKIPNLLAYYPLNEIEDGTTLNYAPATLGTLNGTLTGTSAGSNGLAGRAYDFSSGDHYVTVAAFANQIRDKANISLVCFVRPDAGDNKAYVSVRNGDANDSFYIFQISSTAMEFRYRNDLGTAVTLSPTDLSITGKWSMFSLVKEGASLTGYQNITSLATSGDCTRNIGASGVPMYIGRDGNGNYTGAKIQHVAWFTKALSVSELRKIAKASGVI